MRRWRNRCRGAATGTVLRVPPSDIPGLVLWFDAGSGVTLSATKVTQWVDRAQGFVAAEGTDAKRPVFTAQTAGFNNRPTMAWTTAAATDLINTTDTPVAQSAARTFFAVCRPSNGVAGGILDRRGAGQRAIFQWTQQAGVTYIYTDAVAINQQLHTNPATFQDTTVYLSEVWVSGATMLCWLNGVAQVIDGGTLQNEAALTAGFTIGQNANGTNTFNGAIAEILLYNGALSDANRLLVENYLKTKYAL